MILLQKNNVKTISKAQLIINMENDCIKIKEPRKVR